MDPKGLGIGYNVCSLKYEWSNKIGYYEFASINICKRWNCYSKTNI